MFPGERLHDFDVGLANCTTDLATAADEYTLCTHYNGAVASGATVNLTCDQPHTAGRCLVIKIPYHTEYLTLCEVEVYRGKSST